MDIFVTGKKLIRSNCFFLLNDIVTLGPFDLVITIFVSLLASSTDNSVLRRESPKTFCDCPVIVRYRNSLKFLREMKIKIGFQLLT